MKRKKMKMTKTLKKMMMIVVLRIHHRALVIEKINQTAFKQKSQIVRDCSINEELESAKKRK